MDIDGLGIHLGKVNSVKFRFKVLWAAVKNIFTGKSLLLSTSPNIRLFANGELTIEFWNKLADETGWKHHAVTYDASNPPIGYINGNMLTAKKLDEFK